MYLGWFEAFPYLHISDAGGTFGSRVFTYCSGGVALDHGGKHKRKMTIWGIN